MKRYAFIFARGGSKGLRKKNIKKLGNNPLIAYSIEMALSHQLISKVFVSTEDEEIANISKQYGAEIIHRPEELASDESPEILSWKHAVEYLHNKKDFFDMFISLPATSPFRNNEDITKAINLLDQDTDFVISMSAANRSPYFNMVSKKGDFINLVISNQDKKIYRRQDCPIVYDLTTVVYLCSPKKILKFNHVFEGKVKAVEIPKNRALDIDDEIDFLFAEYLLQVHENVKK